MKCGFVLRLHDFVKACYRLKHDRVEEWLRHNAPGEIVSFFLLHCTDEGERSQKREMDVPKDDCSRRSDLETPLDPSCSFDCTTIQN